MNKTKAILLFLLLVLPVLIYLFLQGFGRNQFAIPIYYENGLLDVPEACQDHPQVGQYQIDYTNVNEILGTDDLEKSINVYEIGNRDSDQLRNNLYTFLEKYKQKQGVNLISIREEMDTLYSSSRYSAWQRFNLPDSHLLRLGRCILRLNLGGDLRADSGLVLVDRQQQIRGYYDPLELKEIDRLNTELYILLSE